jgi:hypothetical protein
MRNMKIREKAAAVRTKRMPEVVPVQAPKERGGIQFLERAFAILEAVARNPGICVPQQDTGATAASSAERRP